MKGSSRRLRLLARIATWLERTQASWSLVDFYLPILPLTSRLDCRVSSVKDTLAVVPRGLAVLSNNQTWPCRRLTLRYWMEGEKRGCGIRWNDSRRKYSHNFTGFTTYCLISVFFVIIGPSIKYGLNCARAHFADVAPAKVICLEKESCLCAFGLFSAVLLLSSAPQGH